MLISVKRIYLVLIICPVFLFAQEQKKTLLVVPLSKNNFQLSSLAEKNIKYNHMDHDSVVDFVIHIINSETEQLFKKYSLHYLNEYNSSFEIPDSTYHLRLFNCFYFDVKDSSLKNIKFKSLSLESYHNNYYGRDFTQAGSGILKSAIASSGCDYILFFNKFEIINPNSAFSLHVEVMDNALNRIYGNKNEITRDISKTMYGDVLKYYIKLSCDEMLKRTESYLNSNH